MQLQLRLQFGKDGQDNLYLASTLFSVDKKPPIMRSGFDFKRLGIRGFAALILRFVASEGRVTRLSAPPSDLATAAAHAVIGASKGEARWPLDIFDLDDFDPAYLHAVDGRGKAPTYLELGPALLQAAITVVKGSGTELRLATRGECQVMADALDPPPAIEATLAVTIGKNTRHSTAPAPAAAASAAGAAAITLASSSPPAADSAWHPLEAAGVLPMTPRDLLRIEGTVSPAAHVAVVWLGEKNQATLIYPRDRLSDGQFPITQGQRFTDVTRAPEPHLGLAGFSVKPAGSETILLLASRLPIAWDRLLAALSAVQRTPDQPEAARAFTIRQDLPGAPEKMAPAKARRVSAQTRDDGPDWDTPPPFQSFQLALGQALCAADIPYATGVNFPSRL